MLIKTMRKKVKGNPLLKMRHRQKIVPLQK